MGFVPLVGFRSGLPDGMFEVEADEAGVEEVAVFEVGENLSASDGGVGDEVGERGRNGVIGGLEEEDAAVDALAVFVFEFTVAVAAAGGLGEGVEAAFGAIDDGETDIDTGFDELGGDEGDGLAVFPQGFGFFEHGDDVRRAHAGGEMEGGGLSGEFFEERLGSFGGVEDEEAAVVGMVKDVGDELFVVEGAEILAGGAFEGLKSEAGSWMISVISCFGMPMVKSSRRSSAGWVAVQRTAVEWRSWTRQRRARRMGWSSDAGRAWTSSKMMTLRAVRWSLRQALVRLAKRDSKNWTLVVTMRGAFQFSEARRFVSVS